MAKKKKINMIKCDVCEKNIAMDARTCIGCGTSMSPGVSSGFCFGMLAFSTFCAFESLQIALTGAKDFKTICFFFSFAPLFFAIGGFNAMGFKNFKEEGFGRRVRLVVSTFCTAFGSLALGMGLFLFMLHSFFSYNPYF